MGKFFLSTIKINKIQLNLKCLIFIIFQNLPDSSDIQFINCITGDNLFDQFELPDTDLADILDYGGQWQVTLGEE